MRTAFAGAQVAAVAGGVDQEAAQRHGVAHHARKGIAAVGAHEAVGVVFGGEEQEFDAARVARVGQGALQRLARGAAPGGVAIEAEHHGVGEAQQFLHMLWRAGRAQRGHGVGKAQLGQRHHVHVAFGDQCVALFADRVARLEQAVQFASLVEHRGLGGVEVLGLVVPQDAAAKANALALDVADGEHDPVAETVVALAVFFIDDDQAAFFEQRVVIVRKHAGQAAPALGGVAQAVLLGHLARDAAPLEVGHGTGRFTQVAAVGSTGFLQHIAQGGLFLAGGGGAFALLGRDIVFRHLEAHLACQVLNGIDKAHARVLHEKADGIAVLATAKAVVELLGRADAERGRFFAVEGAQPHEVGAALLERDIAAHHLDHVHAGEQFLDERLGDRHGWDCPRKLSVITGSWGNRLTPQRWTCTKERLGKC